MLIYYRASPPLVRVVVFWLLTPLVAGATLLVYVPLPVPLLLAGLCTGSYVNRLRFRNYS